MSTNTRNRSKAASYRTTYLQWEFLGGGTGGWQGVNFASLAADPTPPGVLKGVVATGSGVPKLFAMSGAGAAASKAVANAKKLDINMAVKNADKTPHPYKVILTLGGIYSLTYTTDENGRNLGFLGDGVMRLFTLNIANIVGRPVTKIEIVFANKDGERSITAGSTVSVDNVEFYQTIAPPRTPTPTPTPSSPR